MSCGLKNTNALLLIFSGIMYIHKGFLNLYSVV